MSRPKVTVVGAGNVGATTAQYIVERELAAEEVGLDPARLDALRNNERGRP